MRRFEGHLAVYPPGEHYARHTDQHTGPRWVWGVQRGGTAGMQRVYPGFNHDVQRFKAAFLCLHLGVCCCAVLRFWVGLGRDDSISVTWPWSVDRCGRCRWPGAELGAHLLYSCVSTDSAAGRPAGAVAVMNALWRCSR